MNSINADYIINIQSLFHYYKELGDKCLAKLSEKKLNEVISTESNSLAIIINHMAGNMRSRWTNFYLEDGEKEWRNRDTEFISSSLSKNQLIENWESGWTCLFKVIDDISEQDLSKTVLIRNEKHFVMEAINRQLAHYAYHTGQLVFLAKYLLGDSWESLSIPLNKSDDFNKSMFRK
jgi:hypothetical protein